MIYNCNFNINKIIMIIILAKTLQPEFNQKR